MKKKLTTNDMQSLLYHVIRRIDRWWVEKTNLKQGYFTRSKLGDSLVTYKEYVEWRYSTTKDSKNYVSIFISLEYEDSTDYIRIALRTMKNGVYAEYDPFCEIYDGKTEVVISEQTGFDPDNILRDVINTQDFDELTDTIADTVHMFVTSPDEEEKTETSQCIGIKMIPTFDMQTYPVGSFIEVTLDHGPLCYCNAMIHKDDDVTNDHTEYGDGVYWSIGHTYRCIIANYLNCGTHMVTQATSNVFGVREIGIDAQDVADGKIKINLIL